MIKIEIQFKKRWFYKMPDPSVPKTLYRFRSNAKEYFMDELENAIFKRNIFLPGLDVQNDPFDGNPIFKRSTRKEMADFLRANKSKIGLNRAITGLTAKEISRRTGKSLSKAKKSLSISKQAMLASQRAEISLQSLRFRSRIACFSSSYQSLVMWSHYSNFHSGVCIEYGVDTDKLFSPIFYPLLEVEYSSIRPVLTSIDVVASAATPLKGLPGREERLSNFLDATVTTKAPDWKYEKEWRLHLYDGTPPRYHHIDGLQPVSLILGLKSGQADIDRIWEKFGRKIDIFKLKSGSDGYELTKERVVL